MATLYVLAIIACSIIATATIVTYNILYNPPKPKVFFTYIRENGVARMGVTNCPEHAERNRGRTKRYYDDLIANHPMPPCNPPRKQVSAPKVVQELVVKLSLDDSEILKWLESEEGAKRVIKSIIQSKPRTVVDHSAMMEKATATTSMHQPTDVMEWHKEALKTMEKKDG